MTIGSDQLDAWGRTLIEADELYREVQLLIRINPEAYTVDSTALAAVGVANADAWQFAENVADYARCIQFKNDLARTKQALDRMESR